MSSASERTYARHAGFTLLELLLAMAVTALVVGAGVPAFQHLAAQNRLAGATNELLAALNLSRAEAVKRGQRIALCASPDGLRCAGGGDYTGGWIVFSDPDRNADADADADVLRVFHPDTTRLRISAVAGFDAAIGYDPDGITRQTDGRSQTGTLAICQQPPARARCIVIGRSGRPLRADEGCTC